MSLTKKAKLGAGRKKLRARYDKSIGIHPQNAQWSSALLSIRAHTRALHTRTHTRHTQDDPANPLVSSYLYSLALFVRASINKFGETPTRRIAIQSSVPLSLVFARL